MNSRNERGAAVIMAMLVVGVVAALVAGVFWRQNVMIRQAENELSYAQAKWLIRGAIDWAGAVLREDARTSNVDHLGEPWAVPIADTRLNEDDGRDPLYLAGAVRDAQAKYNLRNLAGPDGIRPRELAVLSRLLDFAGVDTSLAEPIARRVLASVPVANGSKPTAIGLLSAEDLANVAGVDAATIERLRPYVVALPQATPVNANTAPAEVLAARFDNLPLADARRLVASRDRAYFKDLNDVLTRLGQPALQASGDDISVATQFFFIDGTVSYRRARLHSLALLRRASNRIETLWMREAT